MTTRNFSLGVGEKVAEAPRLHGRTLCSYSLQKAFEETGRLLTHPEEMPETEDFSVRQADMGGAHPLLRQAGERAKENGQPAEDFYWEDYASTLENWSSYAVSFDQEGMTVGFSPYELACYAAGPQVFRLTYDQLRPHLGPHGRTLLGLENGEPDVG